MTEEQTRELQNAVEKMHDCSASLAETVSVSEEFDGAPVWEGTVHVFDIIGHPTATHAYAWSSPIDGSDKRRVYAVLELPPVQSATDAVRAAILADHRGKT